MRRFIKSLPGKAVGQLVVMALLLPSLTLMLLGKAEAQLTTQPTWAVLPFVVNPKLAGVANLGTTAADAVASELSKTNQYDVVPSEQVKRAAENLGLQLPLTDPTSLLRLAQEVRASTIVTGDVVDYKIVQTGGGRQAVVAMNVKVTDVASGLPINGAGVSARSTVRVGTDVSEETLVSDSLTFAAVEAVSKIQTQTLPTATVLNTTEKTALVNRGARSGFKKGQKVVVVRGREQVATATVNDVEADSAYLQPDRIIKGIQPGDKVRVIFDFVPMAGITNTGKATQERGTSRGKSPTGLIQVALLVGLGFLLFGGGRSSSQNGASHLKSEAEMFPDPTGDPSVKLSWNSDIFVRANSQRVQWQIWRSDVTNAPVLVVQGNTFQAHDISTSPQTGTYGDVTLDFNGQIGGSACDFSGPGGTAFGPSAVTPGRAYQYKIELVYKVAAADLPDGGTTGGGTNTGITTGATGGGTTGGTGLTGGGTTGGTTATTGGTAGSQFCFFISSQTFADGLATPLVRSVGQSPPNNAAIPRQVIYDVNTYTIPFSFSSANTAGANLTLEYVVEMSLSPTFPKNGTSLVHVPTGTAIAKTITNDTGVISLVANNDLFQDVAQNTQIYWRVGVRNTADSPGPVPDSAGNRYVVGPSSIIKRAETPPPPPMMEE